MALAEMRDFEHWVDRCLSCGYGHEFKCKDGKVEDWFQHPRRQPSHLAGPVSLTTDTKLCPDCGKLMDRWTWTNRRVLRDYPGQFCWTWRCDACGHEEPGAAWEAANIPKPV